MSRTPTWLQLVGDRSETPRLAVFIGALLVAGCGGHSDSGDEARPAATEAEFRAAFEQTQLEKFNSRMAKIEAQIAQTPDHFDSIVDNLRQVENNFREYDFGKRARDLLEEQRKRRDAEAEKRTQTVFADVDRLIKVGDFASAGDKLDQFLRQQAQSGMRGYVETPSYEAWERKKDEIDLLFRAENEAEIAKQRALDYADLGQFARAVAVLEAYPKAFSSSPYAEELTRLREDYYGRYAEARAKRQEREKLPWEVIATDLIAWNAYSEGDEHLWREAGDSIEIENTSGAPAFLTPKVGNKWKDYTVDLEVKSPGQALHIGVRRHKVVRDSFQVHEVELDSDDWKKIRLEVFGENLRIVDQGTGRTLVETPVNVDYPQGGFAFLVTAGEEFAVRNVRYRVIELASAEKTTDEEED